jgi:hypothetical protein
MRAGWRKINLLYGQANNSAKRDGLVRPQFPPQFPPIPPEQQKSLLNAGLLATLLAILARLWPIILAL